MDELIYRFLLQSGFPRAAIVTDLALLPLAGAADDEASGDGTGIWRPGFAIVDPATGDRLALVDVVGPVDGDALRAAGGTLGRYGQRFGGRGVQGFVVRVDDRGRGSDEQVQFYRAWPNESLERVSAQAFPDLDSMRTWRLLAERRGAGAPGRPEASAAPLGEDAFAARAREFGLAAVDTADDGDDASAGTGERSGAGPGAWAWLPGLALAGLAVADALAERFADGGFLSVVQALLLIGAATLLLVPALVRRR